MNHFQTSDAAPAPAAAAPAPTPEIVDPTWVLITSFSAILTVLGFAFLGSGAVRYKSVQSAVITVLLGTVIAILFFWTVIYINNNQNS